MSPLPCSVEPPAAAVQWHPLPLPGVQAQPQRQLGNSISGSALPGVQVRQLSNWSCLRCRALLAAAVQWPSPLRCRAVDLVCCADPLPVVQAQPQLQLGNSISGSALPSVQVQQFQCL